MTSCSRNSHAVSLSSRRAWIEIMFGSWMQCSHLSLSSRRAWIEIVICVPASRHGESLSSRRAWIEIVICVPASRHGESLSSRRAWIEITTPWKSLRHSCGRSPHGERGLKCSVHCVFLPFYLCRSPHGERGLKSRCMRRRFRRCSVALLTESVD